MPKGDLPQAWADDIKDFLIKAIKQAVEEIKPEKRECILFGGKEKKPFNAKKFRSEARE